MKRTVVTHVLVLVALLAVPAGALARHRHPKPVYVPPGQSAAAQYTEDVPTAGGNLPVNHVHPTGGHGNRSGRHHGPISARTLRAMSASGATGAAAAALASALAPTASGSGAANRPTGASSRPAAGRHARSHPTVDHPGATPGPVRATSSPARHSRSGTGPAPGSATGQVVSTITGSGGGLGSLMPVLLIGSLVLASGAGIFRMLRH